MGCLEESYHRVGVRDEVFKSVQEALVLHQLGVDIMELGDTHSGRLPHIRVFVLQTFPQRLTQVLGDLVHADAAHCANSEGPDQRVGIFTVLDGWFRGVIGFGPNFGFIFIIIPK